MPRFELWNEFIFTRFPVLHTNLVFVKFSSATQNGTHNNFRRSDDTYFFTPWSWVPLEKLTGSELVKKFPALYGTQRFIPNSQVAATCPYPKPARSNAYPHIPLPEDSSEYYPFIYA